MFQLLLFAKTATFLSTRLLVNHKEALVVHMDTKLSSINVASPTSQNAVSTVFLASLAPLAISSSQRKVLEETYEGGLWRFINTLLLSFC